MFITSGHTGLGDGDYAVSILKRIRPDLRLRKRKRIRRCVSVNVSGSCVSASGDASDHSVEGLHTVHRLPFAYRPARTVPSKKIGD